MAAGTTQEELRRHLRELDEETAQVRRVTDDAKGNVGGEGGGVEDSAEIAEDLTNIEEQDAVLGILRNHRADILANSNAGSSRFLTGARALPGGRRGDRGSAA